MSVPASYYAGFYSGPRRCHCTCGGCRTVLEYPQGARNVRCSVCGYINNVSMLWRGLTPAQEFARSRNLAQITCIGCRTTLLYPQGASAVQQWATLTCGGCRQPLTYASGAQFVRCAACQHTNRVPRRAGADTPAPAPQVKTVIVENPPTLDEHGNEIPQLVLGVTTIEEKKAASSAYI
ncbi:hypothetical protein QBZ16_002603 [Prototheca wickerhamii]|uniref:Zinc finger LSD1-type domain-containing protein n=1 Tax=Prototheca wickerhamii TaxID=3111 RepID=A0AAD9IJU7_PROWI|nr:hypothetical protein QBZ16_002603 [Prototheca wickerhamii]